jgi:hypothetical protein
MDLGKFNVFPLENIKGLKALDKSWISIDS